MIAPLRRFKPLKKTPFKRKTTWKPLKRVSTSKKRRLKRFIPKDVVELVHNRSKGFCERMIEGNRCCRRAWHLHHRLMRSRGGEHTEENLMHLCPECHHFAHHYVAKAEEEGLLIKYKDVCP